MILNQNGQQSHDAALYQFFCCTLVDSKEREFSANFATKHLLSAGHLKCLDALQG